VSPAFTPDCDDLIAFIAGTIPLILGHGAGAEVRGVTGITVFSGMLG
jgi:multidrug efflux pump